MIKQNHLISKALIKSKKTKIMKNWRKKREIQMRIRRLKRTTKMKIKTLKTP